MGRPTRGNLWAQKEQLKLYDSENFDTKDVTQMLVWFKEETYKIDRIANRTDKAAYRKSRATWEKQLQLEIMYEEMGV